MSDTDELIKPLLLSELIFHAQAVFDKFGDMPVGLYYEEVCYEQGNAHAEPVMSATWSTKKEWQHEWGLHPKERIFRIYSGFGE
jgi:hypothetical protein